MGAADPPPPSYAAATTGYQQGGGYYVTSTTTQPLYAATPVYQTGYTYQTVGAPEVIVVDRRPHVNHGLHLIMTIITCGCWFPIWFIFCIIEAIN